jgi:hypothetical protein
MAIVVIGHVNTQAVSPVSLSIEQSIIDHRADKKSESVFSLLV